MLSFSPPRTANLQSGYRNATGPTYFSVSTPAAVKITSASLTGKNIRLPAGYKISGKVTRSNGKTVIPHVPVRAVGTGIDSTTTDSAGNYTLMGLSPGSYEVSFGHDWAADNQTGCWYTTPASKFSASCAHETAIVISSANKTGISPRSPIPSRSPATSRLGPRRRSRSSTQTSPRAEPNPDSLLPTTRASTRSRA